MNIIKFNDENYQNLISDLADSLKNNRLITVFGAGLTAGEKTGFGKTVMAGKELQEYMIKEIIQHDKEYDQEDFEDENISFYTIAGIYFEAMEKNSIDVKKIFQQYFTNVKIDQNSVKYAFLNLPWKTIYTLNVDDAIENHTDHRTIISPDMEVNNNVSDYKSLIKLHGDAKKAILQDNIKLHESIVFSKDAYLKAILGNQRVLSYFISELRSVHTLYFGCSFKTLEFDIETIIANEKNNILSSDETRRFFITTKLTENKIERRKLENDFLVTDVLELTDRNNYKAFMQDLVTAGQQNTDTNNDYDPLVLDVKMLNVDDKEKNKAKLLMLENHNEHIDSESTYSIPYFTIDRDIRNSFLQKIGEHRITLLRGSRFSGKTLFLLNTLKDYGTRKIFFISSKLTLDVQVFNNILMHYQNILLAFDTNSFQDAHLKSLYKNLHKLKENDIKIIFTFNTSNNIVYGLFNNLFDHNDFAETTIKNVLSQNEINLINQKLNSLPLPEFQNTIQPSSGTSKIKITKKRPQNILDNIIRINELFHTVQTENQKYIDWRRYRINNKLEFGLLSMLLIAEKVYTSQFYLIYYDMQKLNQIFQRFSPFIEKEYTSIFEHEQHSGDKITKNCHYCLKHIIQSAISSKKISTNNVADILSNLIDKLYKSNMNLYKEMMLFDNLNDIFDGRQYNHANKIIEKLYENLEKVLTEDKHYWLQRAKSILYISNTDIEKIHSALEYSTKIYLDSDDAYSERIKGHASMTSAMLYGRLITLENFSDIENIERALFYYTDTLTRYSWNTEYVRRLISREHYNDLKQLLLLDDSKLSREEAYKLVELRALTRGIQTDF
jgi:hypothetical protein